MVYHGQNFGVSHWGYSGYTVFAGETVLEVAGRLAFGICWTHETSGRPVFAEAFDKTDGLDLCYWMIWMHVLSFSLQTLPISMNLHFRFLFLHFWLAASIPICTRWIAWTAVLAGAWLLWVRLQGLHWTTKALWFGLCKIKKNLGARRQEFLHEEIRFFLYYSCVTFLVGIDATLGTSSVVVLFTLWHLQLLQCFKELLVDVQAAEYPQFSVTPKDS